MSRTNGGIQTAEMDTTSHPAPPEFDLPFPLKTSPHIERSRKNNVARLKSHGMLATKEAEEWYLTWDMALFSANAYPYAAPENLDLAVDKEAFFFIFDDQFDGPLGQDPAKIAAVVNELLYILHRPIGEALPAGSSPLATFFADVWDRSREGMSARWIGRAADYWEYYLCAHASESIDRVSRTVPSWEHFLEVRRGTAGTLCVTEYIQRMGGFELAPIVFQTPQMRTIRAIAVDVPLLSNDVHSVYKEAARGDVDNAVLVVERDRGCSRAEAMTAVRDLVMNDYLPALQHAESQLPAVCSELGLTEQETEDVHRFTDAVKTWIRGYHEWELATTRYTPAGTISADEPNYVEYLVD